MHVRESDERCRCVRASEIGVITMFNVYAPPACLPGKIIHQPHCQDSDPLDHQLCKCVRSGEAAMIAMHVQMLTRIKRIHLIACTHTHSHGAWMFSAESNRGRKAKRVFLMRMPGVPFSEFCSFIIDQRCTKAHLSSAQLSGREIIRTQV